MNTDHRLQELAYKLFNKTITPEEEMELNILYDSGLDNEVFIPAEFARSEAEQEHRLLQDIRQQIGFGRKRQLWPAYTAAAAVLCVIFIAVLYFNYGLFSGPDPQSKSVVLPGTNRAVLTLSNGQRIDLAAAGAGKLIAEHGKEISKPVSGVLNYQSVAGKASASSSALNTISTPNGGKWEVLLPDGSKVWLNAASAITFAVNLGDGPERIVRLQGEAYFEVKKNARFPFKVYSGGQELSVLGTHFNIKSYPGDPAVQTTLLEGKVSLSAAGNRKALPTLITPGYAARFSNQGFQVEKADLNAAIAWKNGKFVFNGEPIGEIMKQISRWYNVEVIYSGEVTKEEFHAKISREKSLTEVLSVLESTEGVHFKIEGRRIVVRK